MATLEELQDALKNADKAGDTASAQKLADAIVAKRATPGPSTTRQEVQASLPGRILQGARDPIDGLAQLLPRALSGLASLGGFAPNRVSEYLDSEAKRVDAMNATNEADYQASRQAKTPQNLSGLILGTRPEPGFDGGRLAGNILSPVNAAIAARLPAATGLLGRAAVGAGVGAAGGAANPVDMTDPEKSYAGAKLAQVGLGTVTGGVLTPLLGKVGDAAAKWWQGRSPSKPPSVEDLERVARSVVAESGMKWENIAPQMQAEMRDQAAQAIKASAKGVDKAAIMRKADFDAEGIAPTLGQITRDASQYARERNLRTLPGTGDGLLQRFEQQGQQLQTKIGALSSGAQDRYQAGGLLADTLAKRDQTLQAGVREAYGAARASAGKDVEVPMQGLAQDVADIFDRYRTAVPSGVRGQFAKYGLDPGEVTNQRKLFTVEEADKLLKEINKQGSTEPAVNAALGELRSAVKSAVTSDAGTVDVFTPARKLAAERFGLHESVPALKAAAEGKVAADDFVRKYIINGKTDEVRGLAQQLQSNPEAFGQAKAQIGAELQKAAFGQNVAGDKAFAPERFSQALDRLGNAKLSAFFNETEIQQMHRLSRIGAYINSMPNASPVQTSNNWGAIMSVASKIPGFPATAGLLGGIKNSLDNQSAVTRSLAAKPEATLTPEQIGLLGQYLAGVGAGGGLLAGSAVK